MHGFSNKKFDGNHGLETNRILATHSCIVAKDIFFFFPQAKFFFAYMLFVTMTTADIPQRRELWRQKKHGFYGPKTQTKCVCFLIPFFIQGDVSIGGQG
jgi:hypothetical protein